jgi:hypothetical protein
MSDQMSMLSAGRAQTFWCLLATVLSFAGIAAVSGGRGVWSVVWLVVYGALATRVWRGSNRARIALAIIAIPSGLLYAKAVQTPLSTRPSLLAFTTLGLIPVVAVAWLTLGDDVRAFLREQRARAEQRRANAP